MHRPLHTHTLVKLVSFAAIVWLLFSALTSRGESLNVDAARTYLTRYEGYRLTAYEDREWTWSAGIGHSLGYGPPRRMTYTRAEVEAWFQSDLRVALAAARVSVRDFDQLPQDVQLVVVGLIWCVGPTGFAQFKDFRLALSHKAYNAAHISLALSKWAQQVGPARRNDALRVLGSH